MRPFAAQSAEKAAAQPPRHSIRFLAAAVALILLNPAKSPAETAPHWATTWAAAQISEPATESLPAHALEGAALRQVVHISLGGTRLRLHLSNAFGETPLILHSVQLARATDNKTGNQPTVLFHGLPSVAIPAGAEYLSDPINFPAPAFSDIAITLLIDKVPDALTTHSGSRATSFLTTAAHTTTTFVRWYFIAGIEVEAPPESSTLVTLGDSITDGHGATTDANDRWPDVLAKRLAPLQIGVANEGIGGNRILLDDIGPNALARFDRDVLAIPGTRFLIVLEGINDIGALDRLAEHLQTDHDALLERLEAALQQIADRAHAHNIRIFAATVTPFLGSDYYHPHARSESDRTRLNQWIRSSYIFDGIIDFDALVNDPANSGHLAPPFDSGDHLHPGPTGYRRMGEAVPLALFKP